VKTLVVLIWMIYPLKLFLQAELNPFTVNAYTEGRFCWILMAPRGGKGVGSLFS